MTTMRTAALATCMLVSVGATFASSGQSRSAPAGDIEELLDPTRVAASICRKPSPAGGVQIAQIAQIAELEVAGRRLPSAVPAIEIDGLDAVSYDITTRSDEAQSWFDQGLALLYAFNFREAARSFRRAQREDPGCAMCYWGEAMALGPNINVPMKQDDVGTAAAARDEAMRLMDRSSGPERALIEAMAARYDSHSTGGDRGTLDAAYADEMGRAAARFPEDDDIQVLWADSMMNLQPWNYWEADERTPRGNTSTIMRTLETVLTRNPDHPQAIHLYIHMTEASEHAARAAPHADRLGELMPGAGHLVHMPAHTYFRIGRYKDSLEANLRAMQVDQAYLERTIADPLYAHGYYPHNVHFALVSAQMAGDAENVRHASRLLPAVMSDEVAREVGWVQVIKAAPFFAEAQYGTRADAWALSEPAQDFPLIRAMRHYARSVTAALAGDVGDAEAELAMLQGIAAQADFSDLEAQFVPASDMVAIAGHVARGRIAMVQGNPAGAAAAYERARAVQDGLFYMEPPFWYYPVSQSLGGALLAAEKPEEAADAFEAALVAAPNNGWALWGLAQAREASGDVEGAQVALDRLEDAWVGERALLTVERL